MELPVRFTGAKTKALFTLGIYMLVWHAKALPSG